MKTVGACEARTHFSALLDQVGNGESFVITRRGVPVARLCPIPQQSDLVRDKAEAIRGIRQFSEAHRLDGLSVREMIEDGRR